MTAVSSTFLVMATIDHLGSTKLSLFADACVCFHVSEDTSEYFSQVS